MNKLISFLLLMTINITVLATPEEGGKIEENVHYVDLFSDTETAPSDQKVEEFFWWGCPHCYHFEPFLQEWLNTKSENVSFSRVPVVFNKLAAFHAESFYALQSMGVLTHELNAAIFDEIQKKKNHLETVDQFANFLKEQEIDADTYRNTINSFAVKLKVRRAAALSKRYGITGVPSMVVNGSYRTGGRMAGGNKEMIHVIDQLLLKDTE